MNKADEFIPVYDHPWAARLAEQNILCMHVHRVIIISEGNDRVARWIGKHTKRKRQIANDSPCPVRITASYHYAHNSRVKRRIELFFRASVKPWMIRKQKSS